jgi:uncharacterized protein YbjT (DUF2867 family)
MIVVTTPTGQIGQHVLRGLVAAGAPVRAIVRDASKIPADIRPSIDIVEGSHGDAAVIDAALNGAESLFWLVPPDMTKDAEEAYIAFTRPAAEAIRRHQVRRVVGVTGLGRNTRWQEAAGLLTLSIHMDDLLMGAGADFRGLAMPSFMDNAIRYAGSIKESGMFSGVIDPDRKLPLTATRDIGAVAVQLLNDGHWAGQQEIPLLGPEDLSFNDMAATMSDVLGREVRYQQIPFEQLKAQFLRRGASQSMAEGFVGMYRAKNEGVDNVADVGVSDRMPTTFRQWCEEFLEPAVAE